VALRRCKMEVDSNITSNARLIWERVDFHLAETKDHQLSEKLMNDSEKLRNDSQLRWDSVRGNMLDRHAFYARAFRLRIISELFALEFTFS